MLSSTAQNSQLSLPGVTWEQFELVETAFAGIGGVRFIYLEVTGYRLIDRSHFLPELNLGVLSKYINYHDQYDAVAESMVS